MEQVVVFIQEVGFPIAAAIGLGWFIYKLVIRIVDGMEAKLDAVDAKVEGASQRIQEDAMNFAKIVESLGLQIVRAIMLLIAFLPILWGLSSNVVIPFF